MAILVLIMALVEVFKIGAGDIAILGTEQEVVGLHETLVLLFLALDVNLWALKSYDPSLLSSL